MNGHISGYTGLPVKDEIIDRRISNMLTFKPDLTNITEIDHASKESLEKIIALEVAEIVNRKSKIKTDDEEIKDQNITELTQLDTQYHQKATQTDNSKSPGNTLRRKSIQLLNKLFIHENGEDDDDIIEKKIMDDQNSEGDCKASLLDIFRYPNIRKKFFILTFDWIALGVVYNSLSYNTPNLGVNDYLAFFIGKNF